MAEDLANKRFGCLPSRLFLVAAFAADRFSSPYVAAAQQNLYDGFAETAFGRQCRLHAFLWDKRLEALTDTPRRSRQSADLPRSVFGAAVTAKHFETAQRLTLRKDNSDVPRRSLLAELPVLRGRAARCGCRIRVRLLIQTSERNCSPPSKRLAQDGRGIIIVVVQGK